MRTASRLSRIDVIGGGPGGAFAARLLRLSFPDCEVHLYDGLPPEDTFGFGVGLSVSTQKNLGRHDPETFDLIRQASHAGHGFQMHSGETYERIEGNGQVAIARSVLLRILYAQAERAGVTIHTGERVEAFGRDADVVVAADGVNSATRSAAATAFGVRETVGRQKYIWCGADKALPDAVFGPAVSAFGLLTTHAYPYAPDRSTFLVETGEDVWRAAGFDRDMSHLAPGESDEEARSFLESVFKEYLDGASLLGNNSRWVQFRTIHCDRWHHENVVLLGDAAHTAHYSIGSGTKLAMEDAIALTAALRDRDDDLSGAFDAYRQARRGSVEQLQYLARRSELWWESYVDRLAMTPAEMLLSFFSRAGNVSLDALRDREPAVVDRALQAFGGDHPATDPVSWVLSTPLQHGERAFPTRDAAGVALDLVRAEGDIDDPRSPEALAFVEAITEKAAAGQADGIELTGPDDPDAVRRRLDIAEQIKLRSHCLTVVRAPSTMRSDLAAALVARRLDLVAFEQELT